MALYRDAYMMPDSSKAERLIDAITLLLGGTDRLDESAHQFYEARSEVAHEGRVQDPNRALAMRRAA